MNKLTISAILLASSLNGSDVIDYGNFGFGINSSLFNSKSHQTVFYPSGYYHAGKRISELTWEANDIQLVGLNLNYTRKDVEVYFSYKKSVSSVGDGVMDDLDWAYVTDPTRLSHWSHHEDTAVTNVDIMDFGIKKKFVSKYITPWIGLGYREENQSYKAYDGYGEYYGRPVTFDGLGITFDQKYKGVYASTGVDLKILDFIIYGAVKYSPFVTANFTDRHHLRQFTMTTEFDSTEMLNLNGGLGYNLNDHHTIAVTYEETKYTYKRGNRTRTYDWGQVYKWSNSVGLDNKNRLVNVNYNYKF